MKTPGEMVEAVKAKANAEAAVGETVTLRFKGRMRRDGRKIVGFSFGFVGEVVRHHSLCALAYTEVVTVERIAGETPDEFRARTKDACRAARLAFDGLGVASEY